MEQWRAVYRTPASARASKRDRDRGYVERKSQPFPTPEDVVINTWELRRPNESHAKIVRWERRTLTASTWTGVKH